jgi:hypothetical protein
MNVNEVDCMDETAGGFLVLARQFFNLADRTPSTDSLVFELAIIMLIYL